MAKKKSSETAGSDAGKKASPVKAAPAATKPAAAAPAAAPAKKAAAPAAPAKKSTAAAATAGAPLIDTSLAANAAAAIVGSKLAGNANAQAGNKKESGAFKQLKAGLNKPANSSLGGAFSVPQQSKKSPTTFGGSKQVGHNQTFGADVNRAGVPRRTPG